MRNGDLNKSWNGKSRQRTPTHFASMSLQTSGCPPGTGRDLWFRFPANATHQVEACDVNAAVFYGFCSLYAVVMSLLTLMAAWSGSVAKSRTAKADLYMCIPSGVAGVVLFAGSCGGPFFWSGDPSNAVFIFWALWMVMVSWHIVRSTSTIRSILRQLLPRTLVGGGVESMQHDDRVERLLIILFRSVTLVAALIWILGLPFALPYEGVPWTLRADYLMRQDFLWALGCWLVATSVLLFLAVPARSAMRLILYIRQVRQPGAGALAANSGLRLVERKLLLAVVQIVLSGIPSIFLWVVFSNVIYGPHWYLILLNITLGLGLTVSSLYFYSSPRTFLICGNGPSISSAVRALKSLSPSNTASSRPEKVAVAA
jgi:hypothetical protein